MGVLFSKRAAKGKYPHLLERPIPQTTAHAMGLFKEKGDWGPAGPQGGASPPRVPLPETESSLQPLSKELKKDVYTATALTWLQLVAREPGAHRLHIGQQRRQGLLCEPSSQTPWGCHSFIYATNNAKGRVPLQMLTTQWGLSTMKARRVASGQRAH